MPSTVCTSSCEKSASSVTYSVAGPSSISSSPTSGALPPVPFAHVTLAWPQGVKEPRWFVAFTKAIARPVPRSTNSSDTLTP